jgi:hypothetical protein
MSHMLYVRTTRQMGEQASYLAQPSAGISAQFEVGANIRALKVRNCLFKQRDAGVLALV